VRPTPVQKNEESAEAEVPEREQKEHGSGDNSSHEPPECGVRHDQGHKRADTANDRHECHIRSHEQATKQYIAWCTGEPLCALPVQLARSEVGAGPS
jgi:hypothetical protein